MQHRHPAASRGAMSSTIVVTLALLMFGAGTALADGRTVYESVCQRCHGFLTEQSSRRPDMQVARILPAVMLPLGPTLNGIVGRPVGMIEGFRYSNGMKKLAASGAVWDAQTLDRYLTDTQKMVRGSYMILKVKEPDRGAVIAYLTRVARHKPQD